VAGPIRSAIPRLVKPALASASRSRAMSSVTSSAWISSTRTILPGGL
jgi:hypothetical protein